MKHCSCHCSACGSHFSSLRAFDSHRSGPHDGERVCWDPDHEHGLRLATEAGRCDLTADLHEGIVVWEHAESVDRVREVFGRKTANTHAA